jgi:hypothetical protein
MPVPSLITDISATLASNASIPSGGESPILTDDYLRTAFTFIAQLRDGTGFTTAVRSNVLGSASVPAHSFVGSTNTGMFSPSAGALALSVSGAEAMRIDSSGNVGIGTASPGDKLHVIGNTRLSNNSAFRVNNVAGTPQSLLTLGVDDNVYMGQVSSPTAGALFAYGSQFIFTGATERMRIDSSGNVGIGTTGPGGKFHVENSSAGDGIIVRSNGLNANKSGVLNSLVLGCDYNTAVSFVAAGGNATNTTLAFYTAATAAPAERMRIDSSGNVGIGRTPTVKLDVNGGVAIGTVQVIGSGSYTVLASDYAIRLTGFATVTLPAAASCTGRILRFFTSGGGTTSLTSASSNVVLQSTLTPGTTIFSFSSTAKWCDLQSDGTYWYVIGGNFA